MARRRWTIHSGLTVVILLVASVALSATIAALGPDDTVTCGGGHLLNRLAQAVTQPLGAGHIDGPAGSHCVVPSAVAWLMAFGTFILTAGVAILVMKRRAPA